MSLSRIATIEEVVHIHYGKGLRKADRDESGQHPVWASSGQVGFHSESLHDDETIIIGRKGSVGSVFHAPDGGWTIDTAFYLEPKKEPFEWRYLYYALINANLAQHTITTSIPGISRKDIYSTRIPFPLPEEQRRIATILDQTDALRRKRQESLALMDKFLRSVFLNMFGDPVVNPRGWTTTTLGELLGEDAIVDGPFGSSLKPDAYTESGVRVIRNANIGNGEFLGGNYKYVTPEKYLEIERSNVIPGDVLLSSKGTLGKVCTVPMLEGPSVLSASGTIRIRTSETLESIFLSSCMNTQSYQRYIGSKESGTNQKYLNLSTVRNFEIIVPPKTEQQRFKMIQVKYLEELSKQRTALEVHQRLFNSMVQRAFRGEL